VSEARIRLAGADDALVVAALTLQCALHRGATPERGFLDRFARAWAAQVTQRPAWIAEVGQEHAGYLLALAVRPLPWPGRAGGGGTVHVDTFFVRPGHRGVGVGEQLLRAAVGWARAEGYERVAMTAGPHTRPMVERVGFTASEGHREVLLG
jgi:GNAT superfamily N-acetyltransferase